MITFGAVTVTASNWVILIMVLCCIVAAVFLWVGKAPLWTLVCGVAAVILFVLFLKLVTFDTGTKQARRSKPETNSATNTSVSTNLSDSKIDDKFAAMENRVKSWLATNQTVLNVYNSQDNNTETNVTAVASSAGAARTNRQIIVHPQPGKNVVNMNMGNGTIFSFSDENKMDVKSPDPSFISEALYGTQKVSYISNPRNRGTRSVTPDSMSLSEAMNLSRELRAPLVQIYNDRRRYEPPPPQQDEVVQEQRVVEKHTVITSDTTSLYSATFCPGEKKVEHGALGLGLLSSRTRDLCLAIKAEPQNPMFVPSHDLSFHLYTLLREFYLSNPRAFQDNNNYDDPSDEEDQARLVKRFNKFLDESHKKDEAQRDWKTWINSHSLTLKIWFYLR